MHILLKSEESHFSAIGVWVGGREGKGKEGEDA